MKRSIFSDARILFALGLALGGFSACSRGLAPATPGQALADWTTWHTGPAAAPLRMSAVELDPQSKKGGINGTYVGTYVESDSSGSASGDLTMTVKKKRKTVSGEFDVTQGSHTHDLSYSGTVKGGKKHAKLTFVVSNPDGRDAYFTATIKGNALSGNGEVPATSSEPEVFIAIQATKQ